MWTVPILFAILFVIPTSICWIFHADYDYIIINKKCENLITDDN